jgi:hypothetical protein
MKINPLINNVHFLSVNAKNGVAREGARADKDGENGRDQYTRQQKREDEGQENESPEERQAKFEDAVQSFQDDPQAQAAGLSAQAEGNGPGLRVVVKNAAGGVVREFTGEEFLRIREAVSGEKHPGKLLDRKI